MAKVAIFTVLELNIRAFGSMVDQKVGFLPSCLSMTMYFRLHVIYERFIDFPNEILTALSNIQVINYLLTTRALY